MMKYLRPVLVIHAAFIVLTGLVYPLAFTGVAQVMMSSQANGSLVSRDGKTVGSALIGQWFSADKYFHGRPSAAGEHGYDAGNSSGSNLGPTSKKLVDRVSSDVSNLRKAGLTTVPADAVTTSASGLDPDISPAFALGQVDRVAAARHLSKDDVRALVEAHTEKPLFGLLGEAHVNVLQLNMALDAMPSPVSG